MDLKKKKLISPQKFCLSEETKDDICLDMLDDVAMSQMQTLMVRVSPHFHVFQFDVGSSHK